MQSGTAIGLLVGGAVLLLAVRPPQAAAINPQTGLPVQNPLSSLNPFNWFGSGQQAVNPAQIFGQQQQLPQQQSYGSPAYNQGGFQNANYTPYGASPGGYSPAGYSPSYTGAPGGDLNQAAQSMPYPVMTPGGGFQSLAYMSPAGSPAASPYAAYA